MTYIGLLMIPVICIYLLLSISYNVDTRQSNFEHINGSQNCLELLTYYKTSIEFEKGFSDNGYSNKADQLEQLKAKELNC